MGQTQDGTVELVSLADVTIGMVFRQHSGGCSVITRIAKRTPRARNRLVSYRNIAPRADGHHNTATVEVSADCKFAIFTGTPPVSGPCPDDCHACQSGGLQPWQGMPTIPAPIAGQ